MCPGRFTSHAVGTQEGGSELGGDGMRKGSLKEVPLRPAQVGRLFPAEEGVFWARGSVSLMAGAGFLSKCRGMAPGR